jgi:hypothetical protein
VNGRFEPNDADDDENHGLTNSHGDEEPDVEEDRDSALLHSAKDHGTLTALSFQISSAHRE